MARLCKCYGFCNKKYKKDEMIEKGSKRYCSVCIEKIKSEEADRAALYNKIIELYKIDFPTGFMLKDIKNFKEERHYTYKGMKLTLEYLYLNKRLDTNIKSVAIIPYAYEQAKQDYIEREKRLAKLQLANLQLKKTTMSTGKVVLENTTKAKRMLSMEE